MVWLQEFIPLFAVADYRSLGFPKDIWAATTPEQVLAEI
jgi:hypothetical protein